MSEPQTFMERPQRLLFKNIIRKIFLEDWLMKLVALAITLTLWLGVTGLSKTTSERYSVPLNLRIADSSIITNSPVHEVEIKISGDDRRMQQVKKGDLVISVDLSDLPSGDRVVSLTPENVGLQLPTGIKLDEIQPNKISVRIESADEKEIQIIAETVGEVASGYEIYSETIAPQRVGVRGPTNFLKSLSNISTEKIDLTGKKEDFVAKQVQLVISNTKTTLYEKAVDVTFRIGEKRVEKVFLVPIKGESGKRAAVHLYGGSSSFNGLSVQDMTVEVDENDAEATPRLILPPLFQNKLEIKEIKIK